MWNLKSNQTIVGDSIIRKPLVVFWILLKYMRCTHLSLRMICEVVFCAVWRLKYWELPSLYVSVFSRNPFIGGVIHHHNFWPFLFFPNLHINTSQCHTLWKLILSVGVKKISSFIHMNHKQQCLMFLYIIKTIFLFIRCGKCWKNVKSHTSQEKRSLCYSHTYHIFIVSWPSVLIWSTVVVDFIMILMRAGTTAAEMASITNLRMGIMCYWNLTGYHLALLFSSPFISYFLC